MNGESAIFEVALKPQPQDLAIFGGPSAFVEPSHEGRPSVGSREHLFERINYMLNRNWLTNDGPFVREFEKRIARFVGVRHGIAMGNGAFGDSNPCGRSHGGSYCAIPYFHRDGPCAPVAVVSSRDASAYGHSCK
jgi:hypothetical protein